METLSKAHRMTTSYLVNSCLKPQALFISLKQLMILSNSIISNLEKRDIENSLEVEHLLELLATGDQSLVATLKELSAKRNWKEIMN